MGRDINLADMMTRVRRRADIEGATSRFPDAEVADMTNESMSALWDLILLHQSAPYAMLTASVTITGGSPSAILPYDVYRLVAARINYQGRWQQLDPIDPRNILDYLNASIDGSTYPSAYILRQDGGIGNGTTLTGRMYIYPQVTATYTIQIEYYPRFTTTAENATYAGTMYSAIDWDGVSGWEEWAVCDAAIKVLQKDARLEEAAFLAQQRDAVAARIAAAAPAHDTTHAPLMRQTRGPRTRELDMLGIPRRPQGW